MGLKPTMIHMEVNYTLQPASRTTMPNATQHTFFLFAHSTVQDPITFVFAYTVTTGTTSCTKE